MKTWARFILSHSLFVSLCAVALCLQTYILLDLKVSILVLIAVFLATLSGYNYYWLACKYFSKQQVGIVFFIREERSHFFLFICSSLALIYFLIIIPAIFLVIITGTFFTFLYSIPVIQLKMLKHIGKAGFLKTFLLAFVWAFVTVFAPFSLTKDASIDAVLLLFVTRFLFILMLCIIFDMRDVAVDKIKSLSSIATDMSTHQLKWLFDAVFLLYLISVLLIADVALVSLLPSGLITYVVYRLAARPRGYFFYYFIVDGLMLFSFIATYMASFWLFC